MDVTEIINIINKLRENPNEYKKIINLSEISDYKENINEISLLTVVFFILLLNLFIINNN